MAGDEEKGWIVTFTGRKVFPLAMRVEDICLEDIAHALAMKCRYTGHVKRFYCPSLASRVLSSDLRWIPAGDLAEGQDLLAFDEMPVEIGMAGKRHRKLRPGKVLQASPTRLPGIRLHLSTGEHLDSAEGHPWLSATKQSGNQKWQTAQEIMASPGRRYLHKFLDPWADHTSRDSGWLAGLWDGEGHLSFTCRKGVQAGVSQRPGLVLDTARALMDLFGYEYTDMATGTRDTRTLQLRGGWSGALRMLGSLRPLRLLDTFRRGLMAGKFSKTLMSRVPPVEVVSSERIGSIEVMQIETDTRTYFCEGYGSHNSVAQHATMMSILDLPGPKDWRLMHDAAEAYLPDIASPIKRFFPIMVDAEHHIERCIAERFGLPYYDTCHKLVKIADLAMMRWEGEHLMPSVRGAGWLRGELREEMPQKLTSWTPEYAERQFLREAERCQLRN